MNINIAYSKKKNFEEVKKILKPKQIYFLNVWAEFRTLFTPLAS